MLVKRAALVFTLLLFLISGARAQEVLLNWLVYEHIVGKHLPAQYFPGVPVGSKVYVQVSITEFFNYMYAFGRNQGPWYPIRKGDLIAIGDSRGYTYNIMDAAHAYFNFARMGAQYHTQYPATYFIKQDASGLFRKNFPPRIPVFSLGDTGRTIKKDLVQYGGDHALYLERLALEVAFDTDLTQLKAIDLEFQDGNVITARLNPQDMSQYIALIPKDYTTEEIDAALVVMGVVSIQAVTGNVDAGTPGQVLEFTINEGKAVKLEHLEARGYTLEYNVDRDVFSGTPGLTSPTGELDPSKLTVGHSFNYQVAIHREGRKKASSAPRLVKIQNFSQEVGSITGYSLELKSGALIPASQLRTQITQVDDQTKITGIKALAKDQKSILYLTAPQDLTFTSSCKNTAIINMWGEILPVNEGLANLSIKVKGADIQETFTIEVVFGSREVTTVTSSPPELKLAVGASRNIVLTALDQYGHPYAGFKANAGRATNAFGREILSLVNFGITGADGTSTEWVTADTSNHGMGSLTIVSNGQEYLIIPVDISSDTVPYYRKLEPVDPARDLLLDKYVHSDNRTLELVLSQYNKDNYLVGRENVGTAEASPYRVVSTQKEIAAVSVDSNNLVTVTAQKAGNTTIQVLQGGILVDWKVIKVIDTTPGLDDITLKVDFLHLNPAIESVVANQILPYHLAKHAEKTPQHIDTLLEVSYRGVRYELVYDPDITSPEHPEGGGWLVKDPNNHYLAKLFVKSSYPDILDIKRDARGIYLAPQPGYGPDREVYLRFRLWDLDNKAVISSTALPVRYTDEIVVRDNVTFTKGVEVNSNVRVLAGCIVTDLDLAANRTIYLDPGAEGKVKLDNCDIEEAQIVVLSGARDTITLKDTIAGVLSVYSSTPVRIKLERETTVYYLAINTPDVTIDNESTAPLGIDLLYINSLRAEVNNYTKAFITTLYVNSPGAHIANDGDIEMLIISAGLAVQQRPHLDGYNDPMDTEIKDVFIVGTFLQLKSVLPRASLERPISFAGRNIVITEELDINREVAIDLNSRSLSDSGGNALTISGNAFIHNGTIITRHNDLAISGETQFEEVRFELDPATRVNLTGDSTFKEVFFDTQARINIANNTTLTLEADVTLAGQLDIETGGTGTLRGIGARVLGAGPVGFLDTIATRVIARDLTFDTVVTVAGKTRFEQVRFNGNVTMTANVIFDGVTPAPGTSHTTTHRITLEQGLAYNGSTLSVIGPAGEIVGNGNSIGGAGGSVTFNHDGSRAREVTFNLPVTISAADFFLNTTFNEAADIQTSVTFNGVTLNKAGPTNIGANTITVGSSGLTLGHASQHLTLDDPASKIVGTNVTNHIYGPGQVHVTGAITGTAGLESITLAAKLDIANNVGINNVTTNLVETTAGTPVITVVNTWTLNNNVTTTVPPTLAGTGTIAGEMRSFTAAEKVTVNDSLIIENLTFAGAVDITGAATFNTVTINGIAAITSNVTFNNVNLGNVAHTSTHIVTLSGGDLNIADGGSLTFSGVAAELEGNNHTVNGTGSIIFNHATMTVQSVTFAAGLTVTMSAAANYNTVTFNVPVTSALANTFANCIFNNTVAVESANASTFTNSTFYNTVTVGGAAHTLTTSNTFNSQVTNTNNNSNYTGATFNGAVINQNGAANYTNAFFNSTLTNTNGAANYTGANFRDNVTISAGLPVFTDVTFDPTAAITIAVNANQTFTGITANNNTSIVVADAIALTLAGTINGGGANISATGTGNAVCADAAVINNLIFTAPMALAAAADVTLSNVTLNSSTPTLLGANNTITVGAGGLALGVNQVLTLNHADSKITGSSTTISGSGKVNVTAANPRIENLVLDVALDLNGAVTFKGVTTNTVSVLAAPRNITVEAMDSPTDTSWLLKGNVAGGNLALNGAGVVAGNAWTERFDIAVIVNGTNTIKDLVFASGVENLNGVSTFENVTFNLHVSASAAMNLKDVTFAASADLNRGATVTLTGDMTINSGQTLTLMGANNLVGGDHTIKGTGTLVLGQPGVIQDVTLATELAGVTVSAATTFNNVTVMRGVTVAGGNTLTLTGNIAGAPGIIEVSGAGTVAIGAAGATLTNIGLNTTTVTLANAFTADNVRLSTAATLAGELTLEGNFELNGANLTLNHANASIIGAGNEISGTGYVIVTLTSGISFDEVNFDVNVNVGVNANMTGGGWKSGNTVTVASGWSLTFEAIGLNKVANNGNLALDAADAEVGYVYGMVQDLANPLGIGIVNVAGTGSDGNATFTITQTKFTQTSTAANADVMATGAADVGIYNFNITAAQGGATEGFNFAVGTSNDVTVTLIESATGVADGVWTVVITNNSTGAEYSIDITATAGEITDIVVTP